MRNELLGCLESLYFDGVQQTSEVDAKEQAVRDLNMHDVVREVVLEVVRKVTPDSLPGAPKQH